MSYAYFEEMWAAIERAPVGTIWKLLIGPDFSTPRLIFLALLFAIMLPGMLVSLASAHTGRDALEAAGIVLNCTLYAVLICSVLYARLKAPRPAEK